MAGGGRIAINVVCWDFTDDRTTNCPCARVCLAAGLYGPIDPWWCLVKIIDVKGLASTERLTSIAAWCAFVVIFVNVLAFTMQVANPTLMADDWYFLSVFGEHAIRHTLSFADFFVRRNGPDHAEPVIKLAILWCIRSFHMDLSVEAVIGVLIAFVYALIFRLIIFANEFTRIAGIRYLGWLVICALLLSLNSTVLWSWAENSMQYSSDILIPIFLLVVWRSCIKGSYWLLPIVTLLMAVVGDDNGIICVIATILALGLYFYKGNAPNKKALIVVVCEILLVTAIVRIGYQFAPHIGAVRISPLGSIDGIYQHINVSNLRNWIVPPLVWGVVARHLVSSGWIIFNTAVGVFVLIVMLLLQVWFWIRAFRSDWNALIFIAVCIMLIFYGWLAGILLYRVPVWGAVAFSQPRYVRLYEFEVISLVLMWLGVLYGASNNNRHVVTRFVGIVACVLVLAVQVPLSITAWQMAPYIRAYYQQQARQTYVLSQDPDNEYVLKNCNPQLPLCDMPRAERVKMTTLLRDNQFGIFSGAVVRTHSMLLTAASALPGSRRAVLVSSMQARPRGLSWERLYASVRALFLGAGEGKVGPAIAVATLPSSAVPVALHGCWPSDDSNGYVSSWCGPSTSFVLKAPKRQSVLQIRGWFPENLFEKAGHSAPVVVAVSVNDVVVTRVPMASGGLFHIDVPLNGVLDAGPFHGIAFVNVSTNGAFFVPSAFSASTDARELSLKLSFVGLVVR